MPELRLLVGGRTYGGWESVNVDRSLDGVAGSFDLQVCDRWAGQEEAWPIREEDACSVEIDGEQVIDGYVDRRTISISGDERTLSYRGRDRTAALESSAKLDVWTFRNATVLDVARKVAEPLGLEVKLQPGLVLPKAPTKLVVAPGDTALSVIERAAQSAGVLVISDGAGGLLICRAGSERAAPLVLGQNLLAIAADYDGVDRFHRYEVVTQHAGSDSTSGGAVRVRGEQTDDGVARTERTLIIRPEQGVTADYAKQRADWEARTRAARAEQVTAVVLGWRQPGGGLWRENLLTLVRAKAAGIDGDMRIAAVAFSKSSSGETTQIRLVRPDAYAPEPARPVPKPAARWDLKPNIGRAAQTLVRGVAKGILGGGDE